MKKRLKIINRNLSGLALSLEAVLGVEGGRAVGARRDLGLEAALDGDGEFSAHPG